MRKRAEKLLQASAWLSVTGMVVLCARVLAYALVPRPSLIGSRLEYQTWGNLLGARAPPARVSVPCDGRCRRPTTERRPEP